MFYPLETDSETSRWCFKCVIAICLQIIKKPNNKELWTIDMQREEFMKCVGTITGGLDILRGFGFVQEEDKMVLKSFNNNLFNQGVGKLCLPE
jgi:hypothetical protein